MSEISVDSHRHRSWGVWQAKIYEIFQIQINMGKDRVKIYFFWWKQILKSLSREKDWLSNINSLAKQWPSTSIFALNASIDLQPTLSLGKPKFPPAELMTFMPSLEMNNGAKSWLLLIKLHTYKNGTTTMNTRRWQNSWKTWR